MRIALDFDGVLAHTMELWVDEYNRLHPSKKITIEDIDRWAFFEKESIGLSYDEAFDIFDFCWRHSELINPNEADQQVKVKRLQKFGKVDIVTSVVKNKEKIKEWISSHGIVPDDIVFTQEKWKLNYDVYIDDSPSNAEKIRDVGKICLLYNQDWNRDVKEDAKIIRVYSLGHVIEILNNKIFIPKK